MEVVELIGCLDIKILCRLACTLGVRVGTCIVHAKHCQDKFDDNMVFKGGNLC